MTDSGISSPSADYLVKAGFTNPAAKKHSAITVLKEVKFDVAAGEVHVLAGENGAGKSTLIKILAGIHTDFVGCIEYCGKEARPRSPLEANELGMAVIHQELSLIGPMSVADNIYLGRTPTRGGFVCDASQHEEALHWVRQLGLEIDLRQLERTPVPISVCQGSCATNSSQNSLGVARCRKRRKT